MGWSGACCCLKARRGERLIHLLSNSPNLDGEVESLKRLQTSGLEVVPTLVLAGAEAEFYLHNNLAEQIDRMFAGVFGTRLDEAKLETACTSAERLLRESYMLPERSDAIRKALPEGLLLVRYAGQAPFTVEQGSQAALWALKRLWASRWQVDAVLERQPELAPPEVPSIIQAVGGELVRDEALLSKARNIISEVEEVWTVNGRVVRAV